MAEGEISVSEFIYMINKRLDETPPKYTPCSGQSRNPNGLTWGICLTDYESMPWWRAEGAGGKRRLFKSYEAALKACKKLEEAEVFERTNRLIKDRIG